MAKKYLDDNGVSYLWGKIKAMFLTDIGYDSSTHQVTKTKNGTTGNVVAIPSKTSDLTNDSGFITSADIPEGSAASTTTPLMDGAASVGTEMAFARGDHRHPSDTTKVDKVTGKGLSTNDYTTAEKNKLASISVTNGVIDSSSLPSFVDDVIEAYARSNQTELGSTWLATGSASGTVITPETGKIYVLMNSSTSYDANSQFRWGGSAYVKLSDGGVSAITNAEIDTIVAS